MEEHEIAAVKSMSYTGENGEKIRKWTNKYAVESPNLAPTYDNPTGKYMRLKTPEKIVTVSVGDVISRNKDGSFKLIKSEKKGI